MAETISLTAYPGAYDTNKSVTAYSVSNPTNPVGKGSDNTTYSSVHVRGSGGKASFYYPFDLSAIPENAEIVSITCRVKVCLSSVPSNVSTLMMLKKGTTEKGTSIGFNSTSTTPYTLSNPGTWTREELQECFLYLEASTQMYMELRFFGADLTITYTVNNEKFMMKSGGAWGDVSKVFKKVGGAWVEQKDLSNVFDPNTNYKKG